MKNIIARHGDLAFTATIEIKGTKIASDKFILAVGEHTNHKHVIEKKTGTLDIYRTDEGKIMLMIDGESVITHEEHRPITLPTGIYEMGNEQEFDYFLGQVRAVQD